MRDPKGSTPKGAKFFFLLDPPQWRVFFCARSGCITFGKGWVAL
jgi:hypothetical protein